MTFDRFDYPSQDVDAPDGFAGYRQLYSSGTDADRGDGPFRASVTVHRFRQLVAFDRHLSGVSHTRGTLRVRRDGHDHINLQLLLAGDMIGGPPDGQCVVQPGEIIFFDMTRPQRTAIGTARLIAFSLPRDRLERHMSLSKALHGTVLPRRAGGLLGEFMQGLIRQGGTLAPHAAEHASAVTAALAASALGVHAGFPDTKLPDEHAAQYRLDRITRHVSDHLSDPGLDAMGAAAALGMSRSTLDRCLAPVGGFGRLLLDMRLNRLRSALRRSGTDVTVGGLAYGLGFRSLSHCSRTFSRRFGSPPQQWRNEQQNARRRRDGDRPGTLDYLFQELR